MIKFLIGVYLLILITSTNCDESSDGYVLKSRNPILLKLWAKLEMSFVESVKLWVNRMSHGTHSHFLSQFKKYSQDLQETLQDSNQLNSLDDKIETITANPIAIYRLLRRIVYLLPQLVSHTTKFGAVVTWNDTWPRKEDVEDAMMSILRLQQVYNLNVTEISMGNIMGVQTGIKLNAAHCYEIGLYAQHEKLYTLASQWFHLVRHKIQDGSILNQKTVTRKMRILLANVTEVNSKESRLGTKFWNLCSQPNHQKISHKLFCRLESKIHPTFFIRPLKIEFLSQNPDVIQIYDILRPQKLDRIKMIAARKLTMSQVTFGVMDSNETKVIKERSSMSGWVDELNDPQLITLGYLVEHITGFKVGGLASEMLQVAVYTPGGYYGPHLDALTDEKLAGSHSQREQGDRVATFMYYLSHVEMGGATAFVSRGTVAQPIKGSALLWYNIYRDGRRDTLTLHGACPVLMGEKWIATTWIRMNDQMVSHPCPTKISARFQFSNYEGAEAD